MPTWIQAFRLDRYISDKATQINLSNLVELMQDTRLSSSYSSLVRPFLKPLNPCQRTAVLSVLMSKDYTLVEGFPGSGKTETMASLIKCLACLHKKALLVSFTHSAVDNVLSRLTEAPIKVVRLGATERVADTVRSFSLEQSLANHIRRLTDKPGSQLVPSLQSAIDFVRKTVESARACKTCEVEHGGKVGEVVVRAPNCHSIGQRTKSFSVL
ncbi:unnamed protein product [Dibothriocephalus latus]|uniref:DNA replication ATP-dependent helicase/nuclease n=1 Tax=Dibothriocephalus latus TaxID=60516 RepID=A0A3P7LGI6_DIBLA|nr:unnamed protein product [Dibothriocephalus latus]